MIAALVLVGLVLAAALSLRHRRTAPTIVGDQNQKVAPPTAPSTVIKQSATVQESKKSPFTLTVASETGGSTSAADKIELHWQSVEGALDYVVIVLTPENDEVWRQKTIAPTARITGDAHLQPGHKYFVKVRANLMEGKSLQSDPVAFTAGNP
jgi:hypothetical protein